MKKIITIITLFIITFSSSFAITWETKKLSINNILNQDIFKINNKMYTNDKWELVEIVWTDFFIINDNTFVKIGDKVVKLNNTKKLYTINKINYIKVNNLLMTLDKYLEKSKIKETKFDDFFKIKKSNNLKLDLLNKRRLEKTKNIILDKLESYILEDNNKNTWTVKQLKKWKFTKEQINKIKYYYFLKWNTKIVDNINKLQIINSIDIKKINKVIKAKLNNKTIKLIKNNEANSEYKSNFWELIKEIGLNDEKPSENIKTENTNSWSTASWTLNTDSNQDDDLTNLLKSFWLDEWDL